MSEDDEMPTDPIQSLEAEVMRLKALVEEAYTEGQYDGMAAEFRSLCTPWEESESYKALGGTNGR